MYLQLSFMLLLPYTFLLLIINTSNIVVCHPTFRTLEARGTGTEIKVLSYLKFCSYLPPKRGQLISATEEDAVPFCTDTSLAKGSQLFPPGFIRTVHFFSTPNYVQVTGTIDHTQYNIPVDDGGGQYDDIDLPDGTCNGYKYWVNLIEPDSDIFCIRCCKRREDCNLRISTYGCDRIVPGNYN